MKRRKTIDKYHNICAEDSRPICPICGEHTYEVEFEDQKYKLDGEEFILKEEFFRCHKDGNIYATPEMVERNEKRLRAYVVKREVSGSDRVKIPSAVKAVLDESDKNMA